MAGAFEVLDRLEQVENIEREEHRPIYRNRRDRTDPFQYYNDMEFRNRFRFTKHGVRYIVDTLA